MTKKDQDGQQRAELKKIVRENRQLTVRSISEKVSIEREIVRRILTEDFDIREVLAKMVLKGPAHMALSVREFLASKQITVLEHPPHSPNLEPSDFFLFLKIKEILKGRHSDDNDGSSEGHSPKLTTKLF
jgi:hypothetical protein